MCDTGDPDVICEAIDKEIPPVACRVPPLELAAVARSGP